jgi:hypothetical protein
LINKGKIAKEKVDAKRSEQLYIEQNSCNFKPALSKHSERIMNERQRDANGNKMNKFSNLYEDAVRRKERQE